MCVLCGWVHHCLAGQPIHGTQACGRPLRSPHRGMHQNRPLVASIGIAQRTQGGPHRTKHLLGEASDDCGRSAAHPPGLGPAPPHIEGPGPDSSPGGPRTGAPRQQQWQRRRRPAAAAAAAARAGGSSASGPAAQQPLPRYCPRPQAAAGKRGWLGGGGACVCLPSFASSGAQVAPPTHSQLISCHPRLPPSCGCAGLPPSGAVI
jgi:hypothetical protein